MPLENQVVSLELAKPIEGHQGYLVMPDGDVYSMKYGKPKKLSRSYDKRGYWRVFLSVGGKPKAFISHRLVAQAFVPNPESLPQVNHKDGNKQNNHFSNLEWCTREHNEQHKKLVLGKDDKGERNGHWGYSKKKMYPNEELRNRLCELGVPRYKHDLAELGEMLPDKVDSFRQGGEWFCIYTIPPTRGQTTFRANTEADARAKMLIYLKEQGLIK